MRRRNEASVTEFGTRPPARWRSWTRRAMPVLQVLASLALLTLLWRAVDGPETARILRGVEFGWLAAALAVISLQLWLSATRWRLTAAPLGQRFGLGEAVKEYYLSQLVNQTLPGGMLGDAQRAVRARHRAGLLRATQAVAFERVAGQIALFFIMASALAITALVKGGTVWPAWLTMLAALPALVVLALILIVRFGGCLPGATGRALEDLRLAVRASLLARGLWHLQIVLSLGTAICNILAFTFCAYATGSTLPIWAIFALIPCVLFAMLFPLSVSGWGAREGAAAAILPLVGLAPEAAIAASIAFGLVFVASVLPGIAILMLPRGDHAHAHAHAPPAQDPLKP
ncbi:MAG: lysylphosphatidylglycerol synthase transmembrane domain-containing protein [Pseudomonadota bacterium]